MLQIFVRRFLWLDDVACSCKFIISTLQWIPRIWTILKTKSKTKFHKFQKCLSIQYTDMAATISVSFSITSPFIFILFISFLLKISSQIEHKSRCYVKQWSPVPEIRIPCSDHISVPIYFLCQSSWRLWRRMCLPPHHITKHVSIQWLMHDLVIQEGNFSIFDLNNSLCNVCLISHRFNSSEV